MEVKEVKISSKVIKKYFVSQNYKYENPKVLIIILAKYKKKQIEFVKKLRLKSAYLVLQTKQLFINVRLEGEDG